MPKTYEPIATTTLGSAAASYTFSSIPGTYTDLVVVANAGVTSGTAQTLLTFNGSSAAYYSNIILWGSGSTAGSVGQANQAFIYGNYYSDVNTSISNTTIFNVQNYSNSTTYKTVLTRGNNAALGVSAIVGLWRGSTGSSTAAITSVTLTASASTYIAGSTFTLYGIKAA